MRGEVYLDGQWVCTLDASVAAHIRVGDTVMIQDKRRCHPGGPWLNVKLMVTGREVYVNDPHVSLFCESPNRQFTSDQSYRNAKPLTHSEGCTSGQEQRPGEACCVAAAEAFLDEMENRHRNRHSVK